VSFARERQSAGIRALLVFGDSRRGNTVKMLMEFMDLLSRWDSSSEYLEKGAALCVDLFLLSSKAIPTRQRKSMAKLQAYDPGKASIQYA
jgi:hypothetical protein